MSCATEDLPLVLSAGQIAAVKFGPFLDEDGAPVDLTGAAVFFTAKHSLADPDSEAVIDVSQDEHAAPETGVTALPIDLSGLADSYFADTTRLTWSIWVVDAQSQRIPWGNIPVEIEPSANRWSS